MPTTNESEPQDEAIRMSRDSRRAEPARRRVLLKLSGEVFGGGSVGVDTTVVRQIAEPPDVEKALTVPSASSVKTLPS